MDDKFYVPIDVAIILRGWGYPQKGMIAITSAECVATPTYSEMIDWLEKEYGIYLECNIWIDYEYNNLVYWTHLITPDGDYGTEDCATREESYNKAIFLIIEENLIDKK